MSAFRTPLDAAERTGALTLPALLASACRLHPEREAAVSHDAGDGEMRWTYGELASRASQIAKGLLASGLPKGARVALLMGNRPEWVAAAFGVTMVGGVLVPLSTFSESATLEYTLRHSDASVLLMQRQLFRHSYLEQLGTLCPETLSSRPGEIRSPRFPFLRRVVCLDLEERAGSIEPWAELLARGDAISEPLMDACAREISPVDDALIIYTSGTTARPKGILHAHRAPTLQSHRFARLFQLDGEDRVWSAYPFFWTAGFAMVMGATLAAGGCLVLQQRFDPGETLDLLEKERVTTPFVWPHQAARLEEHPEWSSRDLSALRHVDPSTPFARHPSMAVRSEWNPNGYGLSETFTLVSALPADTPRDVVSRSHSAILPGNSVRIVDADTGESLGAGREGEIAVKGPTLMKGYVKVSPEEFLDEDGFFRTGDGGFLDEDGHVHWTGRLERLIKTGGANVSPLEIESSALKHPALRAALAVGVPHPTLGEIVVLCAIARDGECVTEQDLRAFLGGQLESYKVPRRALFFREEDFPLTANAKIRAAQVRALAIDRLAAVAAVEESSAAAKLHGDPGTCAR